MGLAASQARFLAITARKADCEFRSMQIAQDKLSITRKMAEITDDYQNSMNKTKLVWDYDGTAEEDQALTYGVMMTPSYLNNYNPHILTTRSGKAVLTSKMAKAAAAVSPNGEPAKMSENGFKTFLNALASNNVITDESKNSFMKALDTVTFPDPNDPTKTIRFYNEQRGNGADPLNKNATQVNTLGGFANQLKDVKITKLSDYKCYNENKGSDDQKKALKDLKKTILINGSEKSEVTLKDILLNDVYIKVEYPDGMHDVVGNNNSYRDPILTAMMVPLTGCDFSNNTLTPPEKVNDARADFTLYNALTSKGEDAIAVDAYKEAMQKTLDQYYDVSTLTLKKHTGETKAWSEIKTDADENNKIVFGKNDGGKYNSFMCVNVSNFISYFLTEFETTLNGYQNGYKTSNKSADCVFVTDDPDYNYLTMNKSAVTDEATLQTDFYMQLYNNICLNGWTENNDISDTRYLEQLIKNGTYFITSLGSDGIFYQNRYNVFYPPLKEVKDEDAIAQAEAEFNAMKLQLTVKEDQLDLDMKNIDMEISSLTTEYDTVKGLVSKNVEKVFTMFQ